MKLFLTKTLRSPRSIDPSNSSLIYSAHISRGTVLQHDTLASSDASSLSALVRVSRFARPPFFRTKSHAPPSCNTIVFVIIMFSWYTTLRLSYLHRLGFSPDKKFSFSTQCAHRISVNMTIFLYNKHNIASVLDNIIIKNASNIQTHRFVIVVFTRFVFLIKYRANNEANALLISKQGSLKTLVYYLPAVNSVKRW